MSEALRRHVPDRCASFSARQLCAAQLTLLLILRISRLHRQKITRITKLVQVWLHEYVRYGQLYTTVCVGESTCNPCYWRLLHSLMKKANHIGNENLVIVSHCPDHSSWYRPA
jgi:hypothetical protein